MARLRLRWIGHTLYAEADIRVDPGLSVGQAHDVAHRAEAHLVSHLPRVAGVTIHTGPATG
ncbi:cation transporter dimerization domain-containing protein [Nakamurella endophytica]|uniref:Cation efflux protein cytoplasmic domain-containing protein n=1 Tax=Nakamurella endophytica TaxID=1748367 RepID=A0A917SRX9_9ACTN|nr:hypothetical protein GCM10011594_09690 [Nakamurella endophytica]